MKGISSFFDKFKNVALKELQKREVIVDIILKTTKQPIAIEDIVFREGLVTIKGNQGMKSEIFLKKKLILEAIAKKGIRIIDIK